MANSGATVTERMKYVNGIQNTLEQSQDTNRRKTTTNINNNTTNINTDTEVEVDISKINNDYNNNDEDSNDEDDDDDDDEAVINYSLNKMNTMATDVTTSNSNTLIDNNSSITSIMITISPLLSPVRRGVGLFLSSVGVEFQHPINPTQIIKIHMFDTNHTNNDNKHLQQSYINKTSDNNIIMNKLYNSNDDGNIFNTDTETGTRNENHEEGQDDENTLVNTFNTRMTSLRFLKIMMKAKKGHDWKIQKQLENIDCTDIY